MICAVLDTNTIVSGVGRGGPSGVELIELLDLAAIVVTPTKTVELVRDPDEDRLIEAHPLRVRVKLDESFHDGQGAARHGP